MFTKRTLLKPVALIAGILGIAVMGAVEVQDVEVRCLYPRSQGSKLVPSMYTE